MYADYADQRYLISGQPILSHLPNIKELRLFDLGHFNSFLEYPEMSTAEQNALLPLLKKALPPLTALAIRSDERRGKLELALVELLPNMTVLKSLDVPAATFGAVMEATNGHYQEHILRTLSGLISLCLREKIAPNVLTFVSGHCTQLTHLFIVVRGEFKPYLVGIKALASLTTLGLNMTRASINGWRLSDDQVHSVLDLRLTYEMFSSAGSVLIGVASLFPSVRVAALQSCEWEHIAGLLAVWPHLETLSWFHSSDPQSFMFGSFPGEMLTHLLSAPNLPQAVDLSNIRLFYGDDDLERITSISSEPGALTAIFRAMQRSSTKLLLLRGPIHREALPRLQGHVDLKPKVTAWKDRDLGDQSDLRPADHVLASTTEFARETDVRIVGKKTGGRFEGEEFSIRVIHQHSKRPDFFE